MNTNDFSCSRCYQTDKFKRIFHFISAVLIPVLLAVFTVILALQQESIAKRNRDVDLRIAAEQHQQNLELAIDEQRNAQLVAYIGEISDLLLANNFSLNQRLLTYIVHPKTLAVLQQLDTTRKSYLLQFLHESRLLSTLNPTFLSLVDANLSHIHIGLVAGAIDMRHLSFSGAFLNNASFNFVSFDYSDFSYARLYGASFYDVSFPYANFFNAQLQEASIDALDAYEADFTNAKMNGAKISQKLIDSAGSISSAILPDGTKGRNPNLFVDPNCQKLVNENGIQQNFSVSPYREWMMKIGRIGKLTYYLTGWFDKSNDLRATLTEFNQNGVVLQKYCYGSKNFEIDLTETQLCFTYNWGFSSNPHSNYTNQYKYVTEKINSHIKTYMINVNITLGQGGTCRDVYFSIETV